MTALLAPSTLPLRISKADLRAARLRIVQLRTEAARETRGSARKELLLTAATIEARIARAS